ncbi:UDP-2,4-diacetamido-2,4,6-trideoxy-beta-L-altropyranose hydrolase [Pusillimonas sp. T2]|uniref:UDP-2,4-diacetamido-2,4, 6-trideoxy-beta-L-altropyranose hydrolase n=1 Tax=Pusillimonas sp. T2 TaxID=1548123 RepID=UPI000B9CEF87|nr:UDP-2,4-diacetamido-2,4,6-trideoxy-beta-L-altropyranose hydrolase [Pusillimonas sp. T2]OXR47997.1 UDP-2,4-diacetamido-2,4,6-trideoxy-beta-L-altropyranose hydrolase [Pusillimonas sp. T2]
MPNVVFRADASVHIGTGHIMRCLTLADALRHRGLESAFICRDHTGHLMGIIREQGHAVYSLQADERHLGLSGHSAWLGATQEMDAKVCRPILERLRPQWLVVDHYALDECWEGLLHDCYNHLLVIDDLADRRHQCSMLLDPNLGRVEGDYLPLTPSRCTRLLGPRYALLRPEFSVLREYSALRRRQATLRSLLVTMGGVDEKNVTCRVLKALEGAPLPVNCRITVIMGTTSPHLAEVGRLARVMRVPTEVLVGVRDMARCMAESDLCIGAAGGTAWERCCLGLPTLLLVLAENQIPGAAALVKAGAAEILELDRIKLDLPLKISEIQRETTRLECMSGAGLAVTSGTGAWDVAALMTDGVY